MPNRNPSTSFEGDPVDFSSLTVEQPFPNSDVALKCKGTRDNGRRIYANKMTLSTHSGFFHGMFSNSFLETEADVIELDADFRAMAEIVGILHNIGRPFTPDQVKVYTPKMMIKMYNVADMYIIPMIKKLITTQLLIVEGRIGLKVATTLKLNDIEVSILRKMSPSELRQDLSEIDGSVTLTFKDLHSLFQVDDVRCSMGHLHSRSRRGANDVSITISDNSSDEEENTIVV